MSGCCATCGQPVPPVYGPTNPAPLAVGPQTGTRLITDPNEKPPLTPYAETDVHTALTRGLAEYLGTVSRPGPAGRLVRFAETLSQWPSPEHQARYPFLMVSGSESGKFDVTAGIGPPLPIAEFDTVTGDQQMRQALFRVTEYEQMLSLDITANDPLDRAFLSLLCSEALSPAPPIEGPWMYGCRLYLPHYYGEVATYEPIGYGYTENADMAMRRERQSVLLVKAKVPMLTLATYPIATPVTRVIASTLPLSPVSETQAFGWSN